MAHTSEYEVETIFIKRLEEIGYQFAQMKTYEDVISNDPKLLIPHRDMQNRRFVLEPLSELCPCYVNQLLQKTVYEMLMELPD